jgi:cyclomaltodextrinase / maltogenic alpha-amylase / neopullulanase
MVIYYDPKDLYHKNPFGPVAEKSAVNFKVGLDRKTSFKEFRMIMWLENGPQFVVRGSWADLRNGQDFYSFQWQAAKPGLYFYHFELVLPDYRIEKGAVFQLSVFDTDFKVPEWLGNGIMYQIFPDRFSKSNKYQAPDMAKQYSIHAEWNDTPDFRPDAEGVIRNNDFFGGNLQGIIEKIPYLCDLGVTIIYLNPIVEAYSNHRYDTADYKNVDPMLGTIDDFIQLCSEARTAGIRIVLDGVFNHTGSDSRYFNKNGRYPELGAFQSKESPYYSWYQFTNYPSKYESWWGIETLPHVREMEPSYLDYIIRNKNSVVNFWLACGASGFRLDVADELPSDFIEELRIAVKKIKPDAVIIGEVWEDASNKISYGERRRYFLGKELDSVMNYPVKDAIIRFIAYEKDAEACSAIIENLWEHYPEQVFQSLMNIMGTHDTARILTVFGLKDEIYKLSKEEKAVLRLSDDQMSVALASLRLALLMWFFLPGLPCIYYGDEIGMEGTEDPFNRRTFDLAKADHELLAFYKEVVQYRKKISDLGQFKYRTEIARGSVFVFSRWCSGKSVIVGINSGSAIEDFMLDLGEDGRIDRFITTGSCEIAENGAVRLHPFSGAVIVVMAQ